jgi:ATP-dependent Lhr-like helicase
MIHNPDEWRHLPQPVQEWFEIQRLRSEIPPPDHLLVETFPRGDRHYLVTYPFEGRLAHQTLGMLLTRRLERIGAKPTGFVASEYAMAVWGMEDLSPVNMEELFHPDMLGDDLDAWLDESALMKRTFGQCAQISGLIHRNLPGKEKNSRQVSFSTDLIYDVLRSHEPDHVLLQAARQDAATGLLDVRRLGEMLLRIQRQDRPCAAGADQPLSPCPSCSRSARSPSSAPACRTRSSARRKTRWCATPCASTKRGARCWIDRPAGRYKTR